MYNAVFLPCMFICQVIYLYKFTLLYRTIVSVNYVRYLIILVTFLHMYNLVFLANKEFFIELHSS